MRIPKVRGYVVDRLERILNPESVAVIGASREKGKIGHTVVKNLKTSFEGKIYPVNPNADQILGLKSYPSVKDIPGKVDLAVISVPAKIVPVVTDDCVEKDVGGAVIITSGFSEIGKTELEDQIVRKFRDANIPMIGPNVVGVVSSQNNLNASFIGEPPLPGKISLVSQSGALGIALSSWTRMKNIGLSSLISIGNMADVDMSEVVKFLAENDEHTRVISIYLEGLTAGEEFVDVCKKKSKHTPIVTLKAGRSERGKAATQSHTGSLAGEVEIYEAAFKQAGVIQVSNLESLFDISLALAQQPPLMGDNIAVITNGGGAGILSTDAAEKYGIPLKETPPGLKEKVREYMPDFASAHNPIDITGQASEEGYRGPIVEALKNPKIDGVAVLWCHTAFTNAKELAKIIKDAVEEADRPKKPVAVTFIGGKGAQEGANWLKSHGIPAYDTPEKTMAALGALRDYGRYLEREGLSIETLSESKGPRALVKEK